MSALATIKANSLFGRLMQNARLVSVTGLAQVSVQAIGFASGILVIRLLPTKEYALYTLANTMLGTMLLLADGGISSGIMAQGGRVWQNPTRLGAVLATGLDLRRKFAAVSLLIALPVLLYLLRHHQAGWPVAILLVLALIPSFFASLSGTLLEIVPRLQQEIIPIQRIQVVTNLGRLALLVVSMFTLPFAGVAILAAGLPQLWANRQLTKISGRFADTTQQPDPIIKQEVLQKVKRLLPDAIYYCIWCQFAVWLVSIYGSTAAVAQLGALGRLAITLTLLSTLFASLVLPRFARLPDDKALLLKTFGRISMGLAVVSIAVIGAVFLFSNQILWVLGHDYKGLTTEMVLMMVGKCMSFVASSLFLLCTSKGWVINPVISISISVLSAAIGIGLLDISTLRGIFTLDILTAGVQLAMHAAYALYSIRKVKEQEPEPAALVAY